MANSLVYTPVPYVIRYTFGETGDKDEKGKDEEMVLDRDAIGQGRVDQYEK